MWWCSVPGVVVVYHLCTALQSVSIATLLHCVEMLCHVLCIVVQGEYCRRGYQEVVPQYLQQQAVGDVRPLAALAMQRTWSLLRLRRRPLLSSLRTALGTGVCGCVFTCACVYVCVLCMVVCMCVCNVYVLWMVVCMFASCGSNCVTATCIFLVHYQLYPKLVNSSSYYIGCCCQLFL